jgi:hypothetical protein
VAELRRRKLVDQLAAYASADLADKLDQPAALTRAMAQASAFLVSIRFLRDDLERVRRLDRAQSSLTFSRLLDDWAFSLRVRPKLQAYLAEQAKGGAGQIDPNLAETFALNEIKSVATELFNEQLLRNVHAILLSNGERAQFETRLLQRVQLRLAPDLRSRPDAEIRALVHLVHLGNQPSIQNKQRTLWELTNDRVDESVARRWASIEWQNFATDVESVEMNVKISAAASTAQPTTSESYSIISKRSRQTRRIEITAPANQGAFYALNRLEQLGVEGQLAQDFQLNESPALARRGLAESQGDDWSHRDRLDVLRTVGRLRLNRFYSSVGLDWRLPLTDRESEKLKELLQTADENFVQFVYFVDLNSQDKSATEADNAMLEQRLKLLSALGVKHFAIAHLQADAVNRLREGLRAVRADVEVISWPASLSKPAVVCLDPQFALGALTVDD